MNIYMNIGDTIGIIEMDYSEDSENNFKLVKYPVEKITIHKDGTAMTRYSYKDISDRQLEENRKLAIALKYQKMFLVDEPILFLKENSDYDLEKYYTQCVENLNKNRAKRLNCYQRQ